MEGPERVVCCTLCLCMAVAVFSSVALVYLTALVYMPAKREFQSALSDVPVMCTTIERVETDECDDWYSCGEWCLSKSSHCVKLWASVRKNGTDVAFVGCSRIQDITCMVKAMSYWSRESVARVIDERIDDPLEKSEARMKNENQFHRPEQETFFFEILDM